MNWKKYTGKIWILNLVAYTLLVDEVTISRLYVVRLWLSGIFLIITTSTRQQLIFTYSAPSSPLPVSAGLCDSDVSVRLSVRTSVRHTPVLCLGEWSRIVKCTPSDSPMILVSGKAWVVEKFARGHPKGTFQMRVGYVFSAIFDQYVFISRKRCILDTKLLWDGNRKPYAGYRMVSLSMTLSVPWPGFQGHGSFKRRISQKPCILHKVTI